MSQITLRNIPENNDQKKRDLCDLCGTWNEQQYKEFDHIDSEIWD